MMYITVLLVCSTVTLACHKHQSSCKESPGSALSTNTAMPIDLSQKIARRGNTTTGQLHRKLTSLYAKYPSKRLELNEIKAHINKTLQEAGNEEMRSTVIALLDGTLNTANAKDVKIFVAKFVAALASSVTIVVGPFGLSLGPLISFYIGLFTSSKDSSLQQWSMIVGNAVSRSRHMSYTEKIMGYYSTCRTITDSIDGMELGSTTTNIQKYNKLDRDLPDTFGVQLLGELESYVGHTLPTIKNKQEAMRLLDVINHYCYVYFWRINLLLRKYGLLRKMGYTGASVKNNIETPAGPNSILFLEFLYTSTQTNSEAIVTSVFYAQVDSWFGISNFLSMHKIKLPTIIPWQEQRLRNENGNYFDSACPDGTHSPRFSSSCISTKFQRDNCIHGHAQYVLPYGYKRNKCVVLVPYKEGQFLIASSGNPHLFLGEHGGYACFIELPRHHPDPSQLFALKLKNSKTSIAN